MKKLEVSIGSPVEVRVQRLRDDDGGPVSEEIWLPATVVGITPETIAVAFSNGQRLAVKKRYVRSAVKGGD